MIESMALRDRTQIESFDFESAKIVLYEQSERRGWAVKYPVISAPDSRLAPRQQFCGRSPMCDP